MKKDLKMLIPLSIILLAVFIVVMILIFQNKQPTITGTWAENETSESVTCTADGISYPFFDYDKASGKNAKIDAAFKNDKLSSIFLVYQMYYDEQNLVKTSLNSNNADMGISFSKNGLSPTAFNISFTSFDNTMQMSLYASANELSNASAKYFLIDESVASRYTKDILSKNYEDQGFVCNIKN